MRYQTVYFLREHACPQTPLDGRVPEHTDIRLAPLPPPIFLKCDFGPLCQFLCLGAHAQASYMVVCLCVYTATDAQGSMKCK